MLEERTRAVQRRVKNPDRRGRTVRKKGNAAGIQPRESPRVHAPVLPTMGARRGREGAPKSSARAADNTRRIEAWNPPRPAIDPCGITTAVRRRVMLTTFTAYCRRWVPDRDILHHRGAGIAGIHLRCASSLARSFSFELSKRAPQGSPPRLARRVARRIVARRWCWRTRAHDAGHADPRRSDIADVDRSGGVDHVDCRREQAQPQRARENGGQRCPRSRIALSTSDDHHSILGRRHPTCVEWVSKFRCIRRGSLHGNMRGSDPCWHESPVKD